jgi:hypothetical protein
MVTVTERREYHNVKILMKLFENCILKFLIPMSNMFPFLKMLNGNSNEKKSRIINYHEGDK